MPGALDLHDQTHFTLAGVDIAAHTGAKREERPDADAATWPGTDVSTDQLTDPTGTRDKALASLSVDTDVQPRADRVANGAADSGTKPGTDLVPRPGMPPEPIPDPDAESGWGRTMVPAVIALVLFSVTAVVALNFAFQRVESQNRPSSVASAGRSSAGSDTDADNGGAPGDSAANNSPEPVQSAVTPPGVAAPTPATPTAAPPGGGAAGPGNGGGHPSYPANPGNPGNGNPPPPNAIRTGSFAIDVTAFSPEEYDLDTGLADAPWRLPAYAQSDLAAGPPGVRAVNGALLAAWFKKSAPSIDDCARLGNGHWSDVALIGFLPPGSYVCVQTSAGRYGFLQIDRVIPLFRIDTFYRVGPVSPDRKEPKPQKGPKPK
jgi:hypothetical protein